MSNARNLADLLGTSTKSNQVISTSGAITTTGAFTSVGIDDNADATAVTISSDEDVSLGAGDLTVSRNEANGTVRLNLSNTGSNGSTEYSELKLNSTAGGTQTSVVQHRNNYGLNVGTTTNHAVYLLQNNANALSIDTSKNVTVNSGNLVIGTSGKGIDFSAASGDASGASSEILDDYEEGTWTPSLLGSTVNPSITTSVAAGKYVRIGGLVFIQWNMIITNVASSGSGVAQVGGLPYAMVGNTYQGYIGIMYNDVWSNETQKGYVPNGGAYITLVPTGRTQTNLGVGTVSTGYFGGGGAYTIV